MMSAQALTIALHRDENVQNIRGAAPVAFITGSFAALTAYFWFYFIYFMQACGQGSAGAV